MVENLQVTNPESRKEHNHRTMLLGLMAGFFLLWFVIPLFAPGVAHFIYLGTLPFRHIGVFVHELGHGLFTLLSGGSFLWFQMEIMEGGVAVTSGGIRAATLLGGLLGPALLGAILLQASIRSQRPQLFLWFLQVLFFTGLCFMFRPLLMSSQAYPQLENWHIGYLLSAIVPLGTMTVTFWVGTKSEKWQRFYLQIFGILMCYAGYSDTAYIFRFQQLPNGLYSDARVFASGFWPGGPEAVPFFLFVIVAALITTINFGLMLWGAWRALK